MPRSKAEGLVVPPGSNQFDKMPENAISTAFVRRAADVLGDTSSGLTGQEIVTRLASYAADFGVEIPYTDYPFPSDVPNKRTALFNNLKVFSDEQKYLIISELCKKLMEKNTNDTALKNLQIQLVNHYGHFAPLTNMDIDEELVNQVRHWLSDFPEALTPFESAWHKAKQGIFQRNALDDLRLSLEILVKRILHNGQSIENNLKQLNQFLSSAGTSKELNNMLHRLIDYYTKYQNSYIKHDDQVSDHEVGILFDLTSSFMKYIVRVSRRSNS